MYVLSVLASRPRLLICDEMLCGLDIDRQASMLQLLQTMQVRPRSQPPAQDHRCRLEGHHPP